MLRILLDVFIEEEPLRNLEARDANLLEIFDTIVWFLDAFDFYSRHIIKRIGIAWMYCNDYLSIEFSNHRFNQWYIE